MQMNIPAKFVPICFSGSLEEDWNVKTLIKTNYTYLKKSFFYKLIIFIL
jgi:hypothetical protein